MRRLQPLILLLLSLTIFPSLAQEECPPILAQLLDELANTCASTGRNEACYGNRLIQVEPAEDIEFIDFDETGEREAISNFRAMQMSPLDDTSNEWGITYMRLQASLPDTLPGENVTFIMIGDVELVNATQTGNPAPNAFYLRTGIGQPVCKDAPPDGLMVQTPEGRGQISFSINGVDVALGSTAFFTAQANQTMTISTLEGTAAIRTNPSQAFLPLVAGTQASIPINEHYLPAGNPTIEDISPLMAEAELIPISLLDREIPLIKPLQVDQIALIQSFISNGLPACGNVPFLPSCEVFPVVAGGELCAVNNDGDLTDCEPDPTSIWESENVIEVIDHNDCIVINCEVTEEAAPPPALIPTLPPGCVPGQCLQDPAVACTCVLCGVACPQDPAVQPISTPPPNTSPGGNNQPPPNTNDNNGNPGVVVTPVPVRPTGLVPTAVPIRPTTDPNSVTAVPTRGDFGIVVTVVPIQPIVPTRNVIIVSPVPTIEPPR